MCKDLKEKAIIVAKKALKFSKEFSVKAKICCKEMSVKVIEWYKEFSPKAIKFGKEYSAKAVEFGKQLPDKTKSFINEAKNNPKQAIVALVIFIVALLLLILAVCTGGKKQETTPAPVVKKVAPVVAPKTEEIIAKPEVKKEVAEEIKEEVAPKAVEKVVEATPQEVEAKPVIKIEPQNVVLTFEATTEKDFMFEVFYTVEREVWYDGKNTLEYPAKAGTNKYSIVLPVKEVFRIRLDFDNAPGNVTIQNIHLTGSQQADLNDFSKYELHNLDESEVNKDGSFSFTSTQEDVYMAFRPALLPE